MEFFCMPRKWWFGFSISQLDELDPDGLKYGYHESRYFLQWAELRLKELRAVQLIDPAGVY